MTLQEAKEVVANKDGYRDWCAIPYHLFDEYYSRAAELYASQESARAVQEFKDKLKSKLNKNITEISDWHRGVSWGLYEALKEIDNL